MRRAQRRENPAKYEFPAVSLVAVPTTAAAAHFPALTTATRLLVTPSLCRFSALLTLPLRQAHSRLAPPRCQHSFPPSPISHFSPQRAHLLVSSHSLSRSRS